jgi:6-phosphogluconate dehydrogenase
LRSRSDFALRRAVWMMVPSGAPVQATIGTLAPLLDKGDVIIDGGNSNYHDSMLSRREARAASNTSMGRAAASGVEGRLLLDGRRLAGVAHIEPALRTLAPPMATPTSARRRRPLREDGHNGIEYGMMALTARASSCWSARGSTSTCQVSAL